MKCNFNLLMSMGQGVNIPHETILTIIFSSFLIGFVYLKFSEL